MRGPDFALQAVGRVFRRDVPNSAFRNVTPGGRGEPRALTCDTVRHSRGVACAATPSVRRESRWKWTFFCT